MKLQVSNPRSVPACSSVLGGGPERRVRFSGFARLLTVLPLFSCSYPLSDVQSREAQGPGAVIELSARLTRSQRDSTGLAFYSITVQALDGAQHPVAGAALTYSVLVSSDSVEGPETFGPDGSAALYWTTRDTLAPLHLLEVRSGETAVLRIAGRPGPLPPSPATMAIPVDTVLGLAPGGIAVSVVDAAGRAVPDEAVTLRVTSGDGKVGKGTLVTNGSGEARTSWQFGPSAGTQTVEVSLPTRDAYRVVDLRTGRGTSGGKGLPLEGIAVPATPQELSLGADTVLADAIGARIRVPALGHDAYGNVIVQPTLSLDSPDTTVVRRHPDGTFRASGTGVARLFVMAGRAKDSLYVAVTQKPVAMAVVTPVNLRYLGARVAVPITVIDRLGAPIPGEVPALRSLTPEVVALHGADTVVALQPGSARLEASVSGVVDTLAIAVVQVPGSIMFPRASDTLSLDQSVPIPVVVFDSGGSIVPNPVLTMSADDPSVVAMAAPGTINARLPGEALVTVQSGPVSATYQVTVEGVALLVDGERTSAAPAVATATTIELTNGRIRLRWHPGISERGGFEMETRTGRSWALANMRGAGDWLYVTSTVVTEPTSVTVVEDTHDRIGLAMRFGDHRFDPVLGQFPASYENEPFPFTRTLWLSPLQYGYFSWTQLERTMVWEETELEVGFGGVFGPARIRTSQMDFRTESMTRHMAINEPRTIPDAAELDLDGDPLMRVLVPLPEAPMISPVFPGWGYGSVYIHRRDYQSYGAYLYAAPRGATTSPRALCEQAWTTAPFPLRTLSADELASCGAT